MKPFVMNEYNDPVPRGFNQPVEWILLREDKVINALDEGKFPGAVLIKLGFGRADAADESIGEWTTALDNSKRTAPYQVRTHFCHVI